MKYTLTFTCKACARTIRKVMNTGEVLPERCDSCATTTVVWVDPDWKPERASGSTPC
jgi:hypothetical protein